MPFVIDPVTGEQVAVAPPPPSAPSTVLGRTGLIVVMAAIRGLTEGPLGRFTFQAPPLEEITRQVGHSHTDYDTVGLGQQSRPGSRQLQTVSFRTLSVDYDASWTLTGATDPLEVSDLLEDVCNGGFPFSLIVGSPELWGRNDFAFPATLRGVGITERAGEVDSRYFDLSFVEFRSPEVVSRARGPAAPTGGTQGGGGGPPLRPM